MKKVTVSAETIELVRHILQARIDHSQKPSTIIAYKNALHIFNYALENNLECLSVWDYLPTKEDIEKDEKNS